MRQYLIISGRTGSRASKAITGTSQPLSPKLLSASSVLGLGQTLHTAWPSVVPGTNSALWQLRPSVKTEHYFPNISNRPLALTLPERTTVAERWKALTGQWIMGPLHGQIL